MATRSPASAPEAEEEVSEGISGTEARATALSPQSPPSGVDESDGRPKQCPKCLARFPVNFKVCPHDASELEDAPDADDDRLGHTLGGTYEIVRIIGEGGMGRVYEARHTRLPNKRYAVKLLHPELARQSEVMARFQREAEASSVLTHANVVSVVDVDCDQEGTPYIVAELLEGEQLGDHLDRMGRLSTGRAVAIVRQICRALDAAHANNIVHRDMKPENVFLAGERQQVKVLDFGISKLGDGNSSLTKTGMVMGTPDYMPPEQAKGYRVDKRADIYAVGAILYRALTGRKPFEEEDQMATLTAVLVQEPPRPRSLNPEIPEGLEVIVQRAMAKEPEERYQTMAEFEQDLASFDEESAERGAGKLALTEHPETERMSWLAGVVRLAQTTGLAKGAKFSRPMIVVLSAVAALWLFAGLCDIAQSTIVLSSNAHTLSKVETWAILVGAAGILITPLVLWYRYVASKVWRSTPRSMDLAERLWGAVTSSAAVYGLGMLCVHLYEGLYRGEPEASGWAGYSIMLFVAAALVGLATWFGARLRGRLSR